MTIHDLEEMDIVKRRDGRVCWILKSNEGEMMTFSLRLWGQHKLSNYNDDFTYNGGGYKNPKLDRQNDIVAVSKPPYKWKALHLMSEYIKAVEDNDNEKLSECMRAFNWIHVHD